MFSLYALPIKTAFVWRTFLMYFFSKRLCFLLIDALHDLVNIYIATVLHDLSWSRTFSYFFRIQIPLLIKNKNIMFHWNECERNKLGQFMCKSFSQKLIFYLTQLETYGSNTKLEVSSIEEECENTQSSGFYLFSGYKYFHYKNDNNCDKKCL